MTAISVTVTGNLTGDPELKFTQSGVPVTTFTMGPTTVVLASCGELTVPVRMDAEDAERLDGRKLSIGSHGYAQMWDKGRVTLVHRWVMDAAPRDGRIVDHLSGDRLDDRKANLRFVTASESSANVKPHGSSGHRGVYPMREKWQARAKLGGRVHYLGTYATPEEAAQVAHLWRLENMPGYTGRGIAA